MSSESFGDMAPDTSFYQAFKIWLQGYVPIDRDFLHALLGAVLLAAAMAFSRPRTAALRALAAAAILGIVMEALDRRDDIADAGAWRIAESASDFGLTILVPLLALTWSLVAGQRSDRSGP